MINKSFQLLRTDPLLTSNIKVVVTSDYNLYLESFNSNNELSNVKYKHFPMQKTEYLENKIPYFYNGVPVDIAFDVRYDDDNKVIQTDYAKQFDTTYYAGGGYIEDQWYGEEFDYLAPLYIRKDNLPQGFIVLRVDDPSGYNLNQSNNFELNSLTANNFHEIVDNWKCVKYFDMTYSSNLGDWLYTNYLNNDRFPKTAFEYHPERAEFSYWYGIDYKTGVYTNKPIFMDDRDEIETPHYRWEKFITQGYKQSGLIFPFILNLKFLFDDTPATPSALRKYSMNRYYGFYIDSMDFVGNITSYRTPQMVPNTYLVNNVIVSGFTGMTNDQICKLEIYDVPSPNPFVEKWDDNKQYYVFIDNTSDFYRDKTISGLYPIQRILQNGKYIYKVVSDEILEQYWYSGYTNGNLYNIKTVDIKYGTYNILSGVTNDFFIDKYIDCDGGEKFMYGDLYLIKINDLYHVIKYSSGMTAKNDLTIDPVTGDYDDWKYFIQTDYAINLNEKYLEYWILGKNSQYYTQLPVQTKNNNPLTFPIYRIKFSDVKDFDFDRVNTGFSDFDYEKTEYVETDEEKLYAFDYNDEAIPPSKRVGKPGSPDQYQISNVSSEYIADDELYEVVDLGQQNTFSTGSGEENKLYDLTDIWRKNQSIVKWGYMGSISHSDYPYKMNNNYEVGGPYNRTTDPFSTIPDVNSKNMDYFYRLGNFYYATTGDTVYYKNQTTNIQWDFISGQLGNGFDIEAYFGGNDGNLIFDYFTFFFKNKMYYEDKALLYTKSYDKYAVFNYGDENVSSITLFKGLKFKIREVRNIYNEGNTITKILYGNKTYNNYKFSIIFNENYDGVDNGLLNNRGYVDTSQNGVNIILNEKFQNILVIVNAKFSSGTTLNDVSTFDEKEGLYYGKDLNGNTLNTYNPYLFTAHNFINAINDIIGNYELNVKYYYIRENDGLLYNGMMSLSPLGLSNSTMTNIPGWNYLFTPFMLSVETPVAIQINNNCYTTFPYYVNSVEDDYVATLLSFDESKSEKALIYRYPGPYEPIFKDVSLFKGGFFCYNDITTGSTVSSGTTYSSASISFEYPNPALPGWSNLLNGVCNPIPDSYVEINASPTLPYTSDVVSRYLNIRGFDFSTIPPDATITGITMTLLRKSLVNSNDSYVRESGIWLARNTYDDVNNPIYRSENKAIDPMFPNLYYWSTNLTTLSYGGPYDLWNDTTGPQSMQVGSTWSGTTLKGSDVSNPLFGVVIQVALKNSGLTNVILPQIKCVSLTIDYVYNKISYTATRTVYFDNNYKFDTTLNDFANIDELIYSKVNETTDILKNSPDIYRIYPCVDEFGYEYSNRFIFKSSWDKEFFVKTLSNVKPDSGTV